MSNLSSSGKSFACLGNRVDGSVAFSSLGLCGSAGDSAIQLQALQANHTKPHIIRLLLAE